MPSVKLSVAIITLNEETNIGRCIDSVAQVADEIVVVDSFSVDKTKEICLAKGVRFIENPFEGHIQQKNFALRQATHDHVLSLDADEALSGELADSIQAVKTDWNADAYQFNRLTSYCGQWIRHCGWYPNRRVRLWDRRKGIWGGVNPHDRVIMEEGSKVSLIAGDLLHYSFPSIKSHVQTVNNFSEIAAREAVRRKKNVNLVIHVLLNPAYTFACGYIFRLGFLDGYYGFVICAISAFANFLKYSKIRQKTVQKTVENE